MRRLVIALVVCVWGVPAASQCDDEAQAARGRVWNSGPFHFEATRGSKDFRVRICGEIVPGAAQRERSCVAAVAAERETVWIGDRRWEKDSAGWRGPYPTIWTHQNRMPSPGEPFSAGQATCLGHVVVDGRATNKYEFARQLGDRIWVETIFTDAHSGLPVRFETRGRSDASTGSTVIYRHDPSIRIDPPAVDLDERWSGSLRRLSEDTEKGDPACRIEFFAAVERGRQAAFEFEIKGSFESIPCCLTGIFLPPDEIRHRLTSYPRWPFRKATGADGRDWAKKSIIASLFPPPEYVGQVRCLGKASVDGRDYDAYEYDFYRDGESARTLYSHRSMMVDEASGLPFRTASVSRRHAPQWVETRRYDPSLTIPAPPTPPPPEATRRPPLTSKPPDNWPPSGWNLPPFVSVPPADAPWPPPVHIWPPPAPFWPPSGLY